MVEEVKSRKADNLFLGHLSGLMLLRQLQAHAYDLKPVS